MKMKGKKEKKMWCHFYRNDNAVNIEPYLHNK